jgi:hypothetical protein
MGLESAASHSLVSSSSPKLSISSSRILDFFKVFDAALGLDLEVGPSDERTAAATSFKAVVRDFRAALERDMLWVLFPMGCVDLGINRQQVLFLGMLPTCRAAWRRLMAAKNRASINHKRHM